MRWHDPVLYGPMAWDESARCWALQAALVLLILQSKRTQGHRRCCRGVLTLGKVPCHHHSPSAYLPGQHCSPSGSLLNLISLSLLEVFAATAPY